MEKYRIVRKLSESSSSRVNLVESSSKQLFVIKEINFNARVSLLDRNQVLQESTLLASLSHPNVLKLIETFVTAAGTLCLVTEYCEGGDLASAVGDCTFEDIKTIVIQLMLALKYLHDKNILHRDLKLKNIFITSRSNGILRIKIGDFGIARSLANSQLATTMVGTPYYLSPELCAKQPYDKSVDIWSLGCVIYELFTGGRHPFNARTLEDLLGRIQVEPVDYSRIILNADVRIEEMLKMMLAKSPKDRLTIDGLLSLPLIQEYIQEFVVKINTFNRPPQSTFAGNFSPSTTIKSNINNDVHFNSALSSTNELLTTMQGFIINKPSPVDSLKIEFLAQLEQATRFLPLILTQNPQRLQKEADRVHQQLIQLLILPSRIQQFTELVRNQDYEGLRQCFGSSDDGGVLKEIISKGLIGDALVMQEIRNGKK